MKWFEESNIKPKPKLLYRATCDGWLPENFHQRCDYQESTLTIIKTDQDYVFGGYYDKSWIPRCGEFFSSNKAFLFTMRSYYANIVPTKMKVTCPSYAIWQHCDYGPCFGEEFLKLGPRSLKFGYSSIDMNAAKTNHYDVPVGLQSNFLTGGTYFTTREIEVFQVRFQ